MALTYEHPRMTEHTPTTAHATREQVRDVLLGWRARYALRHGIEQSDVVWDAALDRIATEQPRDLAGLEAIITDIQQRDYADELLAVIAEAVGGIPADGSSVLGLVPGYRFMGWIAVVYCPTCGTTDHVAAVERSDKHFRYTCSECTIEWLRSV